MSNDDAFRASMNETDQETLRQAMSAADRFAEGVSRFLLAHHLVLYFSSTEARRADVLRRLEDAVERNVDVAASADTSSVEWRRSWPPAARAAILALWRTPRA
jgi:hypothetical protein